MGPSQLFKLILILGLIAISFSRPLSEEDKVKLKKQQPKWKSPPIAEFLEGNVKKKGPLYTYEFKYKSTDDKTCSVTYKEKKKPDGHLESRHKWKCEQGKAAVDPDLVGDDYVKYR